MSEYQLKQWVSWLICSMYFRVLEELQYTAQNLPQVTLQYCRVTHQILCGVRKVGGRWKLRL